jgi:hypothetical protein
MNNVIKNPTEGTLLKLQTGIMVPQRDNFERIQAEVSQYGKGIVPPLLVLAIAYKQTLGQGRVLKTCCGTPKRIEELAARFGVLPAALRSVLTANPNGKLQYYCRFVDSQYCDSEEIESRMRANWSRMAVLLSCQKFGLFLIPGITVSSRNSEKEVAQRVPILIQNEEAQIQLIVKFMVKMSQEVRGREDWSPEAHWTMVLTRVGKLLQVKFPAHWAGAVIGFWYFFRERYLGEELHSPTDSNF